MRKNILITGASAGLGRAMAREFARRGRNLALCARRLDQLEILQTELRSLNPSIQVHVAALDVGDYPQVFEVFKHFGERLGSLDRVIVNAGIGKGQPLGTGRFDVNRQTAEINFVAALAQCEAALQIFRAQNAGHLVTIASMSAFRGQAGNRTAYAASKAGLAALTEGIRADLMITPIAVSSIFPGYIRTDIVKKVRTVFAVDEATGCAAMVDAIEREVANACVPWWPWTPISLLQRHLPLSWLTRMT